MINKSIVAAAATSGAVLVGLPPLSAFVAGIAGAVLYQTFAGNIGVMRAMVQALACASVAAFLAPEVAAQVGVDDAYRLAGFAAAVSFALNLIVPVVISDGPKIIRDWVSRRAG